MSEPKLRVERVFNLGDYKSFRSVAMQSDLEYPERLAIMIDNVADSLAQFFIHQIMEAELYNTDAEKWRKKLKEVNELRDEYKSSLLVEGTKEETE